MSASQGPGLGFLQNHLSSYLHLQAPQLPQRASSRRPVNLLRPCSRVDALKLQALRQQARTSE